MGRAGLNAEGLERGKGGEVSLPAFFPAGQVREASCGLRIAFCIRSWADLLFWGVHSRVGVRRGGGAVGTQRGERRHCRSGEWVQGWSDRHVHQLAADRVYLWDARVRRSATTGAATRGCSGAFEARAAAAAVQQVGSLPAQPTSGESTPAPPRPTPAPTPTVATPVVVALVRLCACILCTLLPSPCPPLAEWVSAGAEHPLMCNGTPGARFG